MAIVTVLTQLFNKSGRATRAIASKLQGGDRIGSKTGGERDGRKRPTSLRNDICPSGGSTDRTNEAASIARYHHHCDLWGDLWSGRMGRHRGIWESEGSLVDRVVAVAQRYSFA